MKYYSSGLILLSHFWLGIFVLSDKMIALVFAIAVLVFYSIYCYVEDER